MVDWHQRFDNVMRQLEREQALLTRCQKELDKRREVVEELKMEKMYISNELLKQKWEQQEGENDGVHDS